MLKRPDTTVDPERPAIKNYLRHLLRTTPDNIYFKDTEGRFLLISHSMARYFYLEHPDEAIGKTDYDFFSVEHARQAQEDERGILASGKAVIGKEEKETWPDGHVSWVSTSKEPLRDMEGRIIGTFGISRDITSRKVAEERAAQYAEELKKANASMVADLALAAELQAALLPLDYPRFPATSEDQGSALRFAHVYLPSQIVGGDFFTVLPISKTEASVFICDGIGHGVRAALLAAILSALFRDRVRTVRDPADCLAQMDHELHALLSRHPDQIFATAVCITVDAETGVLHYSNAGHLAPLILRHASGVVDPLFSERCGHGPALGLVDDACFATGSDRLEPGDRLVLFTDGLVEVLNNESQMFGEEGLEEALQQAADQAPADMLKVLLQKAKAFSQDEAFEDDVCVLCIERAYNNVESVPSPPMGEGNL